MAFTSPSRAALSKARDTVSAPMSPDAENGFGVLAPRWIKPVP